MDPFKHLTEHHVHIQDIHDQQKKITKEQEIILFQLHLADVLLFGAGSLNPEQQKLQNQLQQQYLQGLHQWDIVDIWLTWVMWGGEWIVISNDGNTVKIESEVYCNKKKKKWIRSFSTISGYSKWPLLTKDYWDTEVLRFYIEIPQSYTVKSTAWIPKEALDEIDEIYKQAGDSKTCYALVNTLKYWNPSVNIDNRDDLPF